MQISDNWLVLFGANQQSLTYQDIADFIQARKIKRNQLVWRSGMNDWVKICEVPEFQSLFANIPPDIPLDIRVKNNVNIAGNRLKIFPKKSFNQLLFLFFIGLILSPITFGLSLLPWFISRYYYQYYAWKCVSDKETAISIVIMSVGADSLFIALYVCVLNIIEAKEAVKHGYGGDNEVFVLFWIGVILIVALIFLYYCIWGELEKRYEKMIKRMSTRQQRIAPTLYPHLSARSWIWLIPFGLAFLSIYWSQLCKIIDYFKERNL